MLFAYKDDVDRGLSADIYCNKFVAINAGADPGGKIYHFLAKIVIFHTKYPKKIPASLRSAQFF